MHGRSYLCKVRCTLQLTGPHYAVSYCTCRISVSKPIPLLAGVIAALDGKLDKFALKHYSLGPKGGESLALALFNGTSPRETIRILDLSHNNLLDNAGQILADLIGASSSLEVTFKCMQGRCYS